MSHSLSVVAGGLVAVLLFGAVAEAEFPERKSIEMIVPFSPGGGADSIARVIAGSMTKYLPKDVN